MKHAGLRAQKMDSAAGARPGVLREPEPSLVAVTSHVAAGVLLLSTPSFATDEPWDPVTLNILITARLKAKREVERAKEKERRALVCAEQERQSEQVRFILERSKRKNRKLPKVSSPRSAFLVRQLVPVHASVFAAALVATPVSVCVFVSRILERPHCWFHVRQASRRAVLSGSQVASGFRAFFTCGTERSSQFYVASVRVSSWWSVLSRFRVFSARAGRSLLPWRCFSVGTDFQVDWRGSLSPGDLVPTALVNSTFLAVLGGICSGQCCQERVRVIADPAGRSLPGGGLPVGSDLGWIPRGSRCPAQHEFTPSTATYSYMVVCPKPPQQPPQQPQQQQQQPKIYSTKSLTTSMCFQKCVFSQRKPITNFAVSPFFWSTLTFLLRCQKDTIY